MLSACCICRSTIVEAGVLCGGPARHRIIDLPCCLCRDVWQHSIAAGAHAYLLAMWGWLAGNGWVLNPQQPADSKPAQQPVSAPTTRKASASRKLHAPRIIPSEPTDDWCVCCSDRASIAARRACHQIGTISWLICKPFLAVCPGTPLWWAHCTCDTFRHNVGAAARKTFVLTRW